MTSLGPFTSFATSAGALAHAVLVVVHALAGAAWFGSMFYSLLVLQPRAKAYFGGDGERFEEFVATVARGARWKVLSAFALMLVTGLALIPLARDPRPTWSLALVAAKALLFIAALVLFCHVSWRLWPARIFATPEEVPAFQRRFRRIGAWMIVLVGANLALGVIAHVWR